MINNFMKKLPKNWNQEIFIMKLIDAGILKM